MPIRTVQVGTCDRPGCPEPEIPIDSTFIDAGVYGCAFHLECWHAMPGYELARVLGLDDIRWMVDGERGNKVIYSKEPSA